MKKTRKMVASLVAIVICFAMLLGTTYAWFTDSVINTNNIVMSGEVKVELMHKSNGIGDYEEVDGATKLFVTKSDNKKSILWEPGASASEDFQIKNVGNLALRYEFRVKALARTFTESGKALSEILTLKVTGEGEDKTQVFGDGYTVSGNLLAGKDAKYTVSISWTASENDNDYNVKEDLQILLGIELVATQFTVEEDGTDNQYDVDSALPDVSNMVDLTNDVTEDVTLTTSGENAVKVSLPVDLANELSADKIALVHTEPKVEEGKVIFEAIELIDEDGNTIDLSDNDKEFKITLPAQEKFNAGAQVSIYHDGESVATATVADDKTITYTVKHLCEVAVGPVWDGTADTSWYNDTDTEFDLTSAEQLAGLAELIDGGNTFEGKTINLTTDLDLGNKLFDPIGSYRKDKAFKGTFDGQGHTISNLSQNTWELDNGYYYDDLGMGLFGKVEDATVKNLKIDGASISGENGLCGVVAGAAYGDCTFDNITVSNTKCNDYQYYAGGVVGWASGEQTYSNITIDESTILGSQWGDFGNCTGGVIGGTGSSAKILIKDSTIACRIDAVNDVVSAYQWYCYRNCGMLIGQTVNDKTQGSRPAVAPQLTCENVTVIYGEWANYTYCEFAGTGYPYVRVQAGVSVDAYSNVRYGHPTDANGNTVVDDNHVHNEGEDHHLLLVFDQLYGGSGNDRYCNYGVATHPGVTVIYNNK